MTDDIWTFLSNCKTCGFAHEHRQIGTRQWTWADPDDGHSYRPYLQPGQVADLRVAWERAQEAQTA